MDHKLERVGILFSGGPAPAANAVIGAAASALRRSGCEVVGIRHGYGALQDYDRASRPLVAGEDYQIIADRDLWGLRSARGVLVGTGRANPGKAVRSPADLDDPKKTDRLRRVHEALVDLGLDGLISIGGDDTLRTANVLYEYQRRIPEGSRRVRVVHVPKTIDNDYRGIDFTFGFFTAVGVMSEEPPEPARRRDGDRQLFRRRDHGPQGRLAEPTAWPSPARLTWWSAWRTWWAISRWRTR